MEHACEKVKAVTVILRASELIQEVIKNDIALYGLNQTEFAVLELLYRKGAQPIQVIGKKIFIASSSITYVVDKLEKKKYVKRTGCSEDRRVIFASLTDEGKALMNDVFPKHEKKLEQIFLDEDTNEIRRMMEVMERIESRVKGLK